MTITVPFEALTEHDARKLTTSIQLLLDSAQSTLDRLEVKVIEAYDRRADVALGYASWADYAESEFRDKARYLPSAERREFTIKLSDHGMPSRSIAPVLGISDRRARQITQVGSGFPPAPQSQSAPVPAVIPGDAAPAANPLTGEILETGDVQTPHVEEAPSERIVTGLDGKSYPQRQPVERRGSILDDARSAGWQLRKAIERLERLHQDDRFTKNKVEILAALQPHLDFANEVLADL